MITSLVESGGPSALEVWSPATLITRHLNGETEGRCGYVPDGTPRTRDGLEAGRCTKPTAYLVTSKHACRRGYADVWEVCVDHAPEARLMDWMESIRTAQPIKHVFSCRFGYAPCACT